MIKRTTILNFRIDHKDLDELEKLVKPSGKYKNTSEAIRATSRLGMQVLSYQAMMKDPVRAKEFSLKMQEFIKSEQITEWAETLDIQQVDGFLMLLKIEREKRFEQQKFV